MEMIPYIALALGLISILCLMVNPTVGMVAVFIVRPFIDASWERQFLFGLRPPECTTHSFHSSYWSTWHWPETTSL